MKKKEAKTEFITLRVTPSTKAKMTALAELFDVSVNKLGNDFFERYMSEEARKLLQKQ